MEQTDADTAAFLAEELIDRHRWDAARARLQEGLSANPDHERLLYLAALVEYQEDNYGKARAFLDSLLQASPDHAGGRELLALLHEMADELAAAEKVWLSLLADYPEAAHYFGRYALLMLRTMHNEKALALAQEGLRLDAEDHLSLYAACLAELIAGKRKRYAARMQELLTHHPELDRTAIVLIQVLEDQGRNHEALRIARELLRNTPTHEPYVDVVRHFRHKTHWSLWPLYPTMRWGWTASIGIWFAVVVGMRVFGGSLPPHTHNTVLFIWLGYVVYSWVWPPILKRLV